MHEFCMKLGLGLCWGLETIMHDQIVVPLWLRLLIVLLHICMSGGISRVMRWKKFRYRISWEVCMSM